MGFYHIKFITNQYLVYIEEAWKMEAFWRARKKSALEKYFSVNHDIYMSDMPRQNPSEHSIYT
jgi:hypothetical protein